jgi:hypothetical protein
MVSEGHHSRLSTFYLGPRYQAAPCLCLISAVSQHCSASEYPAAWGMWHHLTKRIFLGFLLHYPTADIVQPLH